MTQTIAHPCERCGQFVPPGSVACPACGALLYRRHLEQLSDEAMRLEPYNPPAAAMVWRRCLDLLPRDSHQFQAIYQRMGALAGAYGYPTSLASGNGNGHAPVPPYRPVGPRPPDSWPVAVAKTGGSMLISILAYAMIPLPGYTYDMRLMFAFAFVVLILIHELGHSLAMRHYGLSASPPIFIPFLGALINMRQQPPNARVEAVVGIGGPVLGSLGAIACFAFSFLAPGPYRPMLLAVSFLGFLLNLFNLAPIPPLDGGRVTAAISPRIWLVGIAGLMGWIVYLWSNNQRPVMLMLILFFALPRVLHTLRKDVRNGKYYDIGRRASWTIAGVYLTLAAVLSVFFVTCLKMGAGRILGWGG